MCDSGGNADKDLDLKPPLDPKDYHDEVEETQFANELTSEQQERAKKMVQRVNTLFCKSSRRDSFFA
jgi:hypothetical protein